jgi:uncharacterized protein DUF6941
MKVRFAFLADYALAHPMDTKLYVIGGGFDTIWAQTFPTRHPQVSLVVRVEFMPAECGRQHTIEIHPLDVDGQPFLPPAKLQVTPQKNPQAPTLPANFALVLNLQGLQLNKPGDYVFSILIDGQEMESLPLHAVLIAPGQIEPPFPVPQLPPGFQLG